MSAHDVAQAQSAWSIERAARVLLKAEDTRTDRGPVTDEWPGLDLPTAYAVQDETLRLRLTRGEHLVGVKLGLTSAAKQARMGIATPLVAWLTDAMALPVGRPVPVHQLIHPRVEPEIVFTLGRRLAGTDVTPAAALDAVASVHVGLEVIDSRYRDFRFTLPDVVADNASSGRFVVATEAFGPDRFDLAREECLLEVDGTVVDRGTGADVQGHPAAALALAANTLSARGHALEPGWIVLTGGITDAVPLPPGSSVTARFSGLGALSLSGG